jgi:predicted methyltransferase
VGAENDSVKKATGLRQQATIKLSLVQGENNVRESVLSITTRRGAMSKLISVLLTVIFFTWALCEAAVLDVRGPLNQAVAGSWRSDTNKARDQYRHPIETLEFFGLKPDMTVVELIPGEGWYTEILAPVLRDRGQLIAATGNLNGDFTKKLSGNPAVFGKVTLLQFSPPAHVRMGPDGSADMVLTFRNLHNWLNNSVRELDSVFQAAFNVLKPGGIFGIEEHRARPYMDAEQSSKNLHRIPEGYVIALGLKNGFVLAGVSQINANPRDDETLNIHQLLPDLSGGKESLKDIGESDRMTLKFVKQSQIPPPTR